MCNRYVSPARPSSSACGTSARAIIGAGGVYPRKLGPFVRAGVDGGRELVVGQWGLIPFFAKSPKLAYQRNNARSEELTAKWRAP